MKNHNLQFTVHNINAHPKHRVELFLKLPVAEQAAVCLQLTKHIQYELLTLLPQNKLITLLEQLDPDEATDVIQLLPKHLQKEILHQLSDYIRNAVEVLLEFDPHTAAGLMDLDYIQVDETETIADASKQFKKHEKRTGRLPVIMVMRNGKVAGYVPGHELGFSRPNEKVKKFVHRITTIPYTTPHKDIIHLFKTHPHEKVAVTDKSGSVLGIIYSDNVLRLLRESEDKSLYNFAGVAQEESVLDSAKYKIHSRYKWLIINLGTAFLASFTVSLFDATISQFVLLAVYMPIVAGMGGNAATQTLAVLVRGIALKQISLPTVWRTLRNELTTGFVNGLINGVIVALVVIIVNQDVKMAIILASAMVVNLVVAAFFGTLVPLIMHRLGKDPAASATIFITTATDVLGFLAFLGLATAILM